MKRTILYQRVSTTEQTRGASLDTQSVGCRLFAEEQGFSVVAEFRDEGVSGATLNRPALNQIRALAAEKAFEVLVVYDADRLARKLAALGYLEVEFERLGVEVMFVNTSNDPLHKLVKGMVGEIERMMIAERSIRNKLATARSGKILGSGMVAFGYEYRADRQFHVVDHEAEVVRKIFAWYAHERCTMHEIVKRLAGLGVPTKRGGKWGKSAVGRILRNEAYTGLWHWRKTKRAIPKVPRTTGPRRREDTTVELRPKEEWIAYTIPVIIDREQFDLVQRRIEESKERNPRNNSKNQYLLRSMVFCGECGRRYVGSPAHGQLFYRCNGTSSGIVAGGHAKCGSKTIRADLLERKVMLKFLRYITSPDLVWSSNDSDEANQEGLHDEVELRSLVSAEEQLDKERSKLLALFKKDLISDEELDRELTDTKQRRAHIAERRAEVEARVTHRQGNMVSKQQVEEQCQEIRGWWRDRLKEIVPRSESSDTFHIEGLDDISGIILPWPSVEPQPNSYKPSRYDWRSALKELGDVPIPTPWFDISRSWLEASQLRVEAHDNYAILRGVLPDIMKATNPDDMNLSPYVALRPQSPYERPSWRGQNAHGALPPHYSPHPHERGDA